MQMRTLGKTGLNVSRACFGTMTFGSQADQAASQRMVDLCIDHGINFFDTGQIFYIERTSPRTQFDSSMRFQI